MRTRSALLALVVGLGLLVAPRADAAVPTLAGTTVVTGTGVHAMRVRVPRTATLSLRSVEDFTQGEAARFRGNGRLIALAIVARPLEDETWLMRSSICAKPGCTSPWRPFIGIRLQADAPSDHQRTELRAGTYTIYLVADGRPASVTLTLGGLSGRTTLRPRLIRSSLWTPAETTNAVDATTGLGVRTYEGDTEVVLDRPGAMVSVMWVQSSLMQARESTCLVVPGEVPHVGPCRPPHIGVTRHAGITCPLCWVTELVTPTSPARLAIGMYGWASVPKGNYSLFSNAEYVGRFGHAGLTTLILPYV